MHAATPVFADPPPAERTGVTLRYRLTRLSRPDARRTFGRGWLAICCLGTVVTLGIVGAPHLFIVVIIWFVCVFAPVRIAVESLHAFGPRLRSTLRRDLERRSDRYGTREHVTVMAELLYEREVRLPRLAPPDLRAKVVDAATGLCDRAFRGGGAPGVLQAATTCSALLERWVRTIATGERVTHPWPHEAGRTAPAAVLNGETPATPWDPGASIQDQWITLRAVAGMAALSKVLVAVYEDAAGRPMLGASAARSAADAAMDYVDQLGLRQDGPAWEDIAGVPRAALGPELAARLVDTWTAFCQAPLPAPRRLAAFLDTLPE